MYINDSIGALDNLELIGERQLENLELVGERQRHEINKIGLHVDMGAIQIVDESFFIGSQTFLCAVDKIKTSDLSGVPGELLTPY